MKNSGKVRPKYMTCNLKLKNEDVRQQTSSLTGKCFKNLEQISFCRTSVLLNARDPGAIEAEAQQSTKRLYRHLSRTVDGDRARKDGPSLKSLDAVSVPHS